MLWQTVLLVSWPLFIVSTVIEPCVAGKCAQPSFASFTNAPLMPPSKNDTKLDIVFLLDVIMTAYYGYDDMSIFVSTLMSALTVSQEYARVGIIPVFGSDYGVGIVSAGLYQITSQDDLAMYLRITKNAYQDFMNLGEYANNAIKTAVMPSFISAASGYRADINNHLLVYITTETDFSDAPTTKEVLKKNTYGVVTIGYGVYAVKHQDHLEKLPGGKNCYFYAPDNSTLHGFVQPVQKLIYQARLNGGHYCGN